jgi:hypothetical protein
LYLPIARIAPRIAYIVSVALFVNVKVDCGDVEMRAIVDRPFI